jgi:flavin reductase (DIM6/NTAB) family NADH-FMN oxidoreductase RutF
MKEPMSDHSPVLQQFPYGLYLVGATRSGRPLLILANWVTQVSFSPPLIAVAIEVDSKMHRHIADAGYFSVNILPTGKRELARDFLKSQEPVGQSVNGHSFRNAPHGSPWIDEAASCLECHVVAGHDAGDHTLFIGRIVQSILHTQGQGMTLKESGLNYQRNKS